MIRYLILAAGIGYRWHDHLGVPKHLVEFDGERILNRTIRQLNERGHVPVVVGPDDSRYHVEESRLWVPSKSVITDTQIDKFLSSMPMWNMEGPTVWLWGDVWWTDEAMDCLTSYHGSDPWHVWYRPGPSSVNGATHGEMFAHRFESDQHSAELSACGRVLDLHRRGLLPWQNTGGWGHYRCMLGLPDDQVNGWTTPDNDHASVIDDWTDDLDTPEDYVTWYGNRTNGRYRVSVIFHDTSESVRSMWPDRIDREPHAIVEVFGNLAIGDSQFWSGVAHAVEHGVMVVPYTHPTREHKCSWERQPMWTAHEGDSRIIIRPSADQFSRDTVRLYGHCWELDE